jgi:hypothetical protein
MSKHIAVLGAGGHTGGFVLAELRRRGLTPIPCDRTTDLTTTFPRADAVINCAGPFVATAERAIAAAIRAGLPYLDVTAELEVVADTFAAHAGAAVPIVPAAAFYGGLGDLLATAALGDWPAADHVTIAYALSSWHPTRGTVATGRVSAQRRGGLRIAHTDHRLHHRGGDAPRGEWTFPAPVGVQPVVGEFTMADSVTLPSHVDVRTINTVMSANAVEDLHAADPSRLVAAGADGRSAQTFLVEVVVRRDGVERRAVARGQDIYAVTAPLVVEAAVRILAGEGTAAGVASVGARFDPKDFLGAVGLAP